MRNFEGVVIKGPQAAGTETMSNGKTPADEKMKH
jgi:hypothetical protein